MFCLSDTLTSLPTVLPLLGILKFLVFFGYWLKTKSSSFEMFVSLQNLPLPCKKCWRLKNPAALASAMPLTGFSYKPFICKSVSAIKVTPVCH